MSVSLDTALPCNTTSINETKQGGVLCQRIAKILDEGPCAVERRLAELDREWTAGRFVKITMGICILTGVLLTSYVSPWFRILTVLAGLGLMQYLFLSRSWLADIFLALGVRSGLQIEDERIMLRILRGDFKHLPTLAQIEDRDALSRMEGEGGPTWEPDEEKYDLREAAEVLVQTTAEPKHA